MQQTTASADFARKIPKLELHAHLNGSISNSTISKLIERKRSQDPEWGKDLNLDKVLRKSQKTLPECFEIFSLIHKLSDCEDAVYTITKDVIQEFAEDNVKYLELRSTPRNLPATGMTKRSYVHSVLRAIKESQNDPQLDIVVRFLLAIDRRTTVEDAWDTLELAKEMKTKADFQDLVVGIDLSGDPNKGDARSFLPVFEKAKKDGLKTALHLAEVQGVNEETAAMLTLPPDRVGHGTYLQPEVGGAEDLIAAMEAQKIPLELCLSSNIITQTVTTFDNHHFAYWYKKQHPFAICTDDKGVFSTTLSEEYHLAATTFDLTPSQLWDISYKTIDHIFAEDSVKCDLRQKWEEVKKSIFQEFAINQ